LSDLGTRLLADTFDPGVILPVKRAAFPGVGFCGVHGFSVLNSQRWGEGFNEFHTLGIRYVILFNTFNNQIKKSGNY